MAPTPKTNRLYVTCSLAVILYAASCSSAPDAYNPRTAPIHTSAYQTSQIYRERTQDQSNNIPREITQERRLIK